jgi:DNA polymerase I-like protein with 3'-5' exonuclease and polymerase domains
MSGDEELCRIYNTEGLSLHDEVRATIFGYYTDWSPELYDKYVEQFNAYSDDTEKSKERVLGEQKMIAKNVNFGIVYGITAFGLAEQIEQPVAAAEQYIGAWFKRFPKAKAFINMCMEAARTGKTITTVYGRKKRPNLITYEKVRDLQNEYANFPHQSTASDIVLDTGIRVRKRLKKDFKTVVNNTVHDSILLKTPYDIPLIKEVYYYVTEELSATPKMMGLTRVPFKADAKVGERWGNLTDFSKWIKSVEEQHNITQH